MEKTVEIRQVSTSRDLSDFTRFPWRIYRGDPKRGGAYYENWVPPLIIDEKATLDTKKNPFYEHADAAHFLAYRGGEIVGRISAIIDDNYNRFHDTRTGFFGFFEAFEDQETADALLQTAEQWVRARDMQYFMGPANPSMNHILGFLVSAFDSPPVIQMGYNPPYYASLVEAYGLEKVKDLYSYKQMTAAGLTQKMKRVSDLARKRYRIRLEPIELKNFESVVETIREIYNDAWSRNWGFVPWTEAEFRHVGEDLKLIVIPELCLLAYIDDEAVGFALPFPDINQVLIKMNGRLFPTGIFKLLLNKRKINFVRVAAMGVKKAHQNKGIDALMVRYIQEHSAEHGILGGDFSWILEENLPLRNMLEAWGATHYKTHRLYGRSLA